MSYLTIDTQKVENIHLEKIIEVFTVGAKSLSQKYPAGEHFLLDLAGALFAELQTRNLFMYRTLGEQSIQIFTTNDLSWAEWVTIHDFLREGSTHFAGINDDVSVLLGQFAGFMETDEV